MFVPTLSRRLVGGALLATSLLAAAPVSAAHAATGCRADPIVWINLSPTNDFKLQVSSSIATTTSDIQSVVYDVHAPAGTYLTSVSYTGGAFAGKETVLFTADNAASTFTVTTTVKTFTHPHGVVVTQSISHPGFNSGTPTVQASGTDSQGISTSLFER